MSKPTLVLVHGSWHCPEHFGPLVADLENRGYKCIGVALPSTQAPEKSAATLIDDTAAVRNTVLHELDLGNNVVAIAHSYGGCPTNNSLHGLSAKDRAAAGFSTSVLAMAFIAAIPIPKGVSFLNYMLGGKPGPIHDLRTPDFAWVGEPGPEHWFYNDLPTAEAKKWSDLLRQQSWGAYTEDTTYAAYKDIPCSYLYCTKDNAIPLEGQKALVAARVADGAQFGYTETVEASHSPFLSMPERTSEFIRQVAGG